RVHAGRVQRKDASLNELSIVAVKRGTARLALSELGSSLANGAAGLLAARLVPPPEFGLVAVASVFFSVLGVATEAGFGRALTQRRAEVDGLIDVAWTWHVVRGLLLTVIMAAAAPSLAAIYAEPRLVPIVLLLSPCALLRGLHNTAVVELARRLDF